MNNAFKVKVDSLGRVTIPIEIRRHLGIKPLEKINVVCDGERVIVFKNETELDKQIRELMVGLEGTSKLSNKEYDTLCEILEKLRS